MRVVGLVVSLLYIETWRWFENREWGVGACFLELASSFCFIELAVTCLNTVFPAIISKAFCSYVFSSGDCVIHFDY